MGLNKIRATIGVAAGKGGVGKSTLCVNLALALAQCGAKVGILVADLYGPSIGKMLPFQTPLREENGWVVPASCFGIEYISLSLFKTGQEAMIVRAPIANQIIDEFLSTVAWSELDLLLIDFPPGTGDIQLTLMQKAALDGALLVSTPQEVAYLDVEKAYQMFKKMNVDVLGLVENMSYLQMNDEKMYPFGKEASTAFIKKHNLTLLSQIPLEAKISSCCDLGKNLFDEPLCRAQTVYQTLAKELFLMLMKKTNQKLTSIELMWKEMV